jgi:hypothetical protein
MTLAEIVIEVERQRQSGEEWKEALALAMLGVTCFVFGFLIVWMAKK